MELEPITRQEKIIAGQDLTPITRMEMFLKQYGGGGGGSVGSTPTTITVVDKQVTNYNYQEIVNEIQRGTGNIWLDVSPYIDDSISSLKYGLSSYGVLNSGEIDLIFIKQFRTKVSFLFVSVSENSAEYQEASVG